MSANEVNDLRHLVHEEAEERRRAVERLAEVAANNRSMLEELREQVRELSSRVDELAMKIEGWPP
jgi:hypothetical protein